MKTKSILYQIFARTKLPSLARHLKDPGLAMFMFHGLTDQGRVGMGNSNHLHIHVDHFADLCAWLKSHTQVLSLTEALTLIRSGKPLPKSSVVLTFDDGYASNFHLAYPRLLEHHLPATIFVATDFVQNRAWLWPDRLEHAVQNSSLHCLKTTVGGIPTSFNLQSDENRRTCITGLTAIFKTIPQESLHGELTKIETELETSLKTADHIPAIYEPLTWDQAREMVASGLITIGAHTHQHLILSRCQPATVRDELTTSNNLITAALGTPPTLFAYPNGKLGDFNHSTHQAIEASGYTCAVTTETGFNRVNAEFDPFTLRRFGQPESIAHLEVLVSGMFPLLTKMARKTNSRAALYS